MLTSGTSSLIHEDGVLRQVDNVEENEMETDESETLTPFTTPSQGKLSVLEPQHIPQIMKRKLSADQIERLYPLVNEMYKTRIIDGNTGDFLPITGQGQRFTGDQVRTAINDISAKQSIIQINGS